MDLLPTEGEVSKVRARRIKAHLKAQREEQERYDRICEILSQYGISIASFEQDCDGFGVMLTDEAPPNTINKCYSDLHRHNLAEVGLNLNFMVPVGLGLGLYAAAMEIVFKKGFVPTKS